MFLDLICKRVFGKMQGVLVNLMKNAVSLIYPTAGSEMK